MYSASLPALFRVVTSLSVSRSTRHDGRVPTLLVATHTSTREWRYSPLEGMTPSSGNAGYAPYAEMASTTPNKMDDDFFRPPVHSKHNGRRRSSSAVHQDPQQPRQEARGGGRSSTSSVGARSQTGMERPYAGGTRHRPVVASALQRKEAERLFPETLPSGRPAQQYTVSQQLFYKANREAAAQVHEQMMADRRLVEEERLLQQRRPGVDWRFFRRWRDYREIQDPDPNRGKGKLFEESKATAQLRTAAWQSQFEKENQGVYLPYERTSLLKRLTPNWFVRYFVQLRDSGGATHMHHLTAVGMLCIGLLVLVGYLFYTAPSRSRPLKEIR